MSFSHLVATILLIAGVVLQLFAVLGLVVMRIVYDRLHYVGLAGYGALLIGISILIQESWSLIGDKALATGVVLVLIGPVVVHTTMRSLRTRERGEWTEGIEDEVEPSQ
ncbi:MAG: monovalent cation/H(+) antiporter subunit G [Solirubrobacterales bacterium]|nr:monovalent cation/H(+) antiporter subunit G [Solirubrobacterales bacterium]